MTEHNLARLYQASCRDDAAALDAVTPAELVDLAEGRLAGPRRAAVVEAIAASPSLAQAWRLARASRAAALELSQGIADARRATARPLHARPALRRLALAATVSAVAVGSVFMARQLGPEAGVPGLVEEDAIATAGFDGRGDDDRIFSSRSGMEPDRIFGQSFNNS